MRTGKYLLQGSAGSKYRAFVPNPLPFKLNIDDSLQANLSEADLELGRLDGIAEVIPDVDSFMLMYIGKEATLSSQVEGTRATFSDLLKAEARIDDGEVHSDVDEIQNYMKAMNYGLKRLETLPLSLRLIREVHAELLSGVRGEARSPGSFRKSQNWIGGKDIATASYVPPPPHELAPLLSNLEKYLHNRAPSPVLIKAAMAHLQFEAIHPFLDGNGRVGRLLVTLFLCEQGALHKPLLYLSEYFRVNRDEYYDRLSAGHDRGYLEAWIGFFLRGVSETAQRATNTAKAVVVLRQDDFRAVAGLGAVSKNAIQLLDHLYRMPVVRIKDVERIVGLSNPNAIALINRFVKLGILDEITQRKRNKVFAYSKYISAFS